jgi:hypothetical protein
MGYPFDLPDHTLSLLRRTSFTGLQYDPSAARSKGSGGDKGEKEKNSSPLLASIKGVTLAKLIEKIVFFEGMRGAETS